VTDVEVSLADPRDFGLPGVTIESGDHICGVYLGSRERHEILAPYLSAGLAGGEKCICVVDSEDHVTVRAGINTRVDVDEYIASHQLDLLTEHESYLRNGAFDLEEMIGFWDESVGAAIRDGGFDFARAVGDTRWVLDALGGFEEFAGYESELNRYAPSHPQAILCLYDLETFGGGILVDLLKTHPKLLMGGLIIENPHYLTPDEYLATRT
jgi:hypothetical protein